ncbi:metacaspase 6, partial [Trifolium medium]|nr:metacaspase 6 [Trifolium medium]
MSIKRALLVAGDTLFVYFTGHGNREEAEPNSNNTNYEEFIHTADGTKISDVTMRMFVECVPQGTCFVLIVDACHSAGMIEGAEERVGRSEVKIERVKKPESLPYSIQTGRHLGTLFAACQSDQVTTCNLKSGSHFTNAIIE